MSQFPPNPQGNFPPGNYPPGNYPPNMQPPYGGGMYQPPMQPRTSGAAITSLIMGILICVPVITGLVAILCGIIGLNSARKPGVSGKGLAIAGLLLGLLNLGGWGVIGVIGGVAWKVAAPDRAVATGFVQDLCSGNTASAQSRCASTVAPEKLDAAITQAQAFGKINLMIPIGFVVHNNNGVGGGIQSVAVTFTNGQSHTFVITLSHPQGGGTPVVETWQIQ